MWAKFSFDFEVVLTILRRFLLLCSGLGQLTPATSCQDYFWAKFSFDFELVLTILRRFFAALQRFRPTDAGNQLPGRLFFQV